MKILIFFIFLAALLVPALGAGEPINIADISAPYLSPGETGVLKVTIVNVGENPLKSVRASLDPTYRDQIYLYNWRSYQEENPVMPVGSPQYYLGYIPQNDSRDAYFNIAAQPGISPGTYLVAVNLEYTLGDSTSIARKIVGITVGLTPRSVLDLSEARLDPPNPAPGQVVNVTLAIVNRKDALIKDLVVTLGAEQKKTSGGLFSQPEKSPGTTIVPLGVSSKALGDLAPGVRAQVEYQLAISNKAEQGPYLVKVLLSYLDQGNMEQNLNREFGLLVSGQPRLDVYPGEAKTSSSETIAKFKVTNSGAGEARDVRARVLENEYFYGKKEVFVASLLGKDDSVDVEAEFISKVKGEGSYPILIGITYQDPSGKVVEKELAQQVYMGGPSGIRGLLILFAIFAFIFYLVNREYKLIRSEILDLLWKKIPRPTKKPVPEVGPPGTEAQEKKKASGEKAPRKEPLIFIPRAPAIGKLWKAEVGLVLISLTVLAILALALPGSPQVSSLEKAPEPEAQAAPAPEPSNPTPEISPTPEVSILSPLEDKVLVKITERGFYPSNLSIRLGDTIIWKNEETVRPRLTLISEDGLFPNATLDHLKIKEYMFGNPGTHNFTLGEYPDLKGEITVT